MTKSKGNILALPLVIAAGISLLFWNERNLIIQRKALKEGSKVVIGLDDGVDTKEINDDHDGKLIHFSGDAFSDFPVYDDIFGVGIEDEYNFLKVRRNVEMYQWVETKDEDGNTSYNKKWEDSIVRSTTFNGGYDNPSRMAYPKSTFVASNIQVDAFLLSSEVVDKMNWYQPYDLQSNIILDDATSSEATLYDNMYYFGNGSPKTPIVGDTRVGFEVIPSGKITVVAKQTESGLTAYIGKSGGSVLLVRAGNHDEDKMFLMANVELTILCWCLRFFGWVLVYIGFRGMMDPLGSLCKCFPFAKRVLEAGMNKALVVLATGITAVTIAVAWVIYRPLVSGIAMLVFVLLGLGLWFVVKKKLQKEGQEAQEAQIVSEVSDVKEIPDATETDADQEAQIISEVPDATETDTYGTPDTTDIVSNSKVMEEP